jgi:hypothetical protein
MAYYLQMDGVDDVAYWSGTSVNIDEVIMDVYVEAHDDFDKYLGTSHSGYLQWNGSSDQWATWAWQNVYVNGTAVTNNTVFVPLNTRTTIRITGISTGNTSWNMFANNNTGGGSMKGRIYSFTFKNAGNVVASYDMTLGQQVAGKVQDQSGNGRHATIVGAVWVSDGAGGTDASITSVIATSTADSIAPTVTAQQQVSVSSVVANVNSDALSPTVSASSGNATTVSAVVASATVDVLSPVVTTIMNQIAPPGLARLLGNARMLNAVRNEVKRR